MAVQDNSSGKKTSRWVGRSRAFCSITGCTTQARKSTLCIKHLKQQQHHSGLPSLEGESKGARAPDKVVLLTETPSTSNNTEHRDGKKFKRSEGRCRRLCDALECTSVARTGKAKRLCVRHSKQLDPSVSPFHLLDSSTADKGSEPRIANTATLVKSDESETAPDAVCDDDAFQTHMDFNARLNESFATDTADQSMRDFLSCSYGSDSLLKTFANNNPTDPLPQMPPLNEQQVRIWELFHTMVLPDMWSKRIGAFDSAVVIHFGLERGPNIPLHEWSLPRRMELLIGSDNQHALCVNGKPVVPSQTSVILPKLCRPFTRENVAEVLASLAHLYAPCSNSVNDNSGKCELVVRNTRSVCPSCRKHQLAQRRRNMSSETGWKAKQNHATMTREHVLQKYRAEIKKRAALEKELRSILRQRAEREQEIVYLTMQLRETNSLEDNMEEPFRMLMKQMKAMYACNKYGRRYDPQFSELCCEIYHYGPRTYRLLRDQLRFPFPSDSTINEMLREFDSETGLSESLLESIKNCCHALPDAESQWALVFDEMALSENVSYDFHKNRIEGLVDYGEFHHLLTPLESRETAKHALVFMLLNMHTKQLQPLCFYFTAHTAKSKILRHMISGIMERLIDSRINVLCTVCDASSSNQSAMYQLGVRINIRSDSLRMVNYFEVRGKKILVLFDTPHLLKCCRNQFVAHNGFSFCNPAGEVCDQKASVEHIRQLIDFENSEERAGLKEAFKLKDVHTWPNNWEKMRVRYAAQLFSQSTAGALQSMEWDFTKTTELLCLFIDELFDLMNSYSKYDKPQKHPVEIGNLDDPENSSPQLSRLRAMQNHLVQWFRAVPQSQRMKNETLGRWILSIESMIELCIILIKNHGFDYVMTKKISQDRLENFFGVIRNMCGSNRNPTTSGFRYAFRKQLRHVSFKWAPKSGNASVEDDIEGVVENYQGEQAEQPQAMYLLRPENCTYRLPDDYCFSGSSLSIEKQNHVYYIAGVAVRYLRRLRPKSLANAFLTSVDEVQKCAMPAASYTQKRNIRNLLFVKPAVSEYFFDLEHAFQTILFSLPADGRQRIIALPEISSSLASSPEMQQRKTDLVKAVYSSSSADTVIQLEAAMNTVTFRYLKIRTKRLVEQMQRYRTGFAECTQNPENA